MVFKPIRFSYFNTNIITYTNFYNEIFMIFMCIVIKYSIFANTVSIRNSFSAAINTYFVILSLVYAGNCRDNYTRIMQTQSRLGN